MVRLDDDLPSATAVAGLDDPSSRRPCSAIPRGVLEHCPQVRLAETAIRHALQQVNAECEIPLPPRGPLGRFQLPILRWLKT